MCREAMLSFSDSFSIHPNISPFPGLESTFAATSPGILHQADCAIQSDVLPLSLAVIFK